MARRGSPGMARCPAVTLVMAVAVVGMSLAAPSSGRASTPAATPPTDSAGLVEIGDGRRLYLECRGSGGPTVVLEAGYRTSALTWSEDLEQPEAPRPMVLPAVAAQTRVCLYERPGVAALLADGFHPSRSDPVPMPRTAESVVADLHALLAAAGESGPYVLVGHSLGGLFVRLFAATYPDEVVGLVLVDALSPELETFLTSEQWDTYVRFNLASPPEVADYPALETVDFDAAAARLREAVAANPLPPLPLAVVSKGQPFGVSAEALGFDPAALESAWAAAQAGLATLTPDARHVVATESGHYVQLEQPELVIEATDQVVAAIRDPATWSLLATPLSS